MYCIYIKRKGLEYENAKKDEDEMKIRLEELESRLNQIEKGEDGQSNSGYSDLINTQNRDYLDKESKLKQLRQRIDGCKKEIRHLEENVNKLKNETAKGESNRQECELRIQRLRMDLKKIEYDEEEYIRLQKLYSELDGSIKSIRNSLEDCESQLDSSLQFRYTDPEPGFDRSRVKGLVAELIEVRDAKYNQAIEVTAGGKLYQVVVDTEKTGEMLLKKGNLQRRVTIIPLNRIKHNTIPPSKVKEAERLAPKGSIHLALTLIGYDEEVQEAIEYVFGSTVVCDNLEIARNVTFNKSIRLRSVTLDGDIFEPSGIIEGGSRNTSNPILPMLSKVNELRHSLKEKEEEFSRVSNQYKQMSTKRQSYLTNKSELELLLHNLELIDRSNGDELKIKEDELNCKKKECNDYEMECEELIEAKKNSEKRLEELKAKSEELKQLGAANVNGLKKEINECRKLVKKKTDSVERVMNEREELRLEYDELEKELKDVSTRIDKEKQLIDEHSKSIELLGKSVDELKDRYESVKKESLLLKDELSKRSKELSALNKELEICMKEMDKNDKRLTEIKHKKDKLSKLRKDAEKRVTILLKEHSWLKEEESEFGKEGSDFDFKSLNMKDLDTKISHLEEEQESLGRKLNKKVLGMMEKAESEYQELLKKRQIIENDRNQIVKVIEELDVKKKETLVTTYEKVNQDFGSIFSTLLPGASARLEPTNGDVLSGLEVHVAFGGKEKESLSELSGGQRSLLALSLVLSLLLFKPAPMYILDEVDAALDLSHTQNIGKMLRKHFGQSQFIVVSLKEGMFTNANVIFRTKFVDGVSTVTRTLGQVEEESSKRRKTD